MKYGFHASDIPVDNFRGTTTETSAKKPGRDKMMERHTTAFFRTTLTIVSVVIITGCTQTFTRVRNEWKGLSQGVQTVGQLTVESVPITALPPSMVAQVQACDQMGQLLFQGNQPVIESKPIVPIGGWLMQLKFTNQTDHVVRLHGAVIRFFDPAGSQFDPLPRDDVAGLVRAKRPCPSTEQLVGRLQSVKFIDGNTELLPNVTTTGWLFFTPSSLDITGVWKVTLYDVIVETDAAGTPTKKATFEWATEMRQYQDSYKQEFMQSPELIGSEPM